jgi:16S rRNA (cytosine1402-N4)-methyltransferase
MGDPHPHDDRFLTVPGQWPIVDHDLDTAGFRHLPVMLAEVLEVFEPVPAGLLVDATVGGAGHARALLEARDDVDLLGLDRDEQALRAAATGLESFGDRVTLRRARFDQLGEELRSLGRTQVSGVLFDLGVSSPQLDVPERGFSYRQEGPLDMRMDDRDAVQADEIVNGYDEARLAGILRRHADERHARRVARAIVAARPIHSTTELAEIVRSAIPAAARRTGGHPAKRTFQAIRIEVNRELEVLPAALEQAIDALAEGGRCAVLSYHSGEDRVVKDTFRRAAGEDTNPPAGFPVEPRVGRVRFVSRRARRPSAAEVESNRRAESARLRAVECVRSEASDAPASDQAEVTGR